MIKKNSINNFKKTKLSLGLLIALTALTGNSYAQGNPSNPLSNQLEKIDFSTDANNHVLITADFSKAAPIPSSFITEDPARLSIDLPNTSIGQLAKYINVNSGEVEKIDLLQSTGRSRIVIELKDKANYQITPKADKLVIDIGESLTASTNTVAPVINGTSADGSIPTTAANPNAVFDIEKISGVDFKKGDKNSGKIILSFTNLKNPPVVQEEGDNLVLHFKNTNVNPSLVKRFDVLDFATPVKYFDAVNKGGDAEIVINTFGDKKFIKNGYALANQYIMELQPTGKLVQRSGGSALSVGPYKGDRITLAFQSVDVRALLQIIADVAQSNIVISDSVSGQMAMNLKDVRWDQALDVVLRTKGLGVRRKDNVMLIAPVQELAAREKLEQEVEKSKIELAPLHSELIQINYGKASELAIMLKAKNNSLLTDRGSVSVDNRTNTLLVLETQDKIDEIKSVIQTLDKPIRQVLIEARIVVTKDSFDKEFGVQFGTTATGSSGTTSGVTSGTGTSTNTSVTTGATDTNINDRYNVNLPVSSPAGTIAFAILSKSTLVDLELSALQSEGKSEVISTPHVITANNKPALIEQGVEIPYQESASSGATTIAFKDAVLSLNVTPQITPDGRIIMDLDIKNDSVGSNVSTGSGGTVPSIDTRKVKSQVLVDNGQTVVLGGIYEVDKEDQVTEVPFLGDIPYLGNLFKNTVHSNTKTELLVFITPKIISDQITLHNEGK